MKRIILTTADNNYFDMLSAFLYSLRANNNEYHVRADLINYSDDQVAKLKKIYPNLDANRLSIPDCVLLSLMRTRPKQMWKALNEDWDQILSMDCDVIVRGSLDKIWCNVLPGVLKIRFKSDKTTSKCRMQGGVYLFGNSDITKSYYKEFMETIGENFDFYDGQLAMFNMRNKIQIVLMKETFNDDKKSDWNKKSIVWHAKHGRLGNRPFKQEFDKYLTGAKNCYDN